MQYWWVNQNQTYSAELRGSFMWSPRQNANGARNKFYENMREASAGDVVFSFCDTRIKAIGIVTGGAQTGPKPDFGAAGANWSREGWFVPVDYCVLSNQVRPKEHAATQALADALIGLIGHAYWEAYSTIAVLQSAPEPTDADKAVADAGIVGPTFRDQLVRARRGQGVFRANVLLREDFCRVTHSRARPQRLIAPTLDQHCPAA